MTKWLVAEPAPVSAGAREVERIEWTIPERPLLHACCANDTFGDVRLDIRPEVHPDYVCDISQRTPFRDKQFKASFMDYPWVEFWARRFLGKAMRELLRVSEIVYTLGPYTYGSAEIESATFKLAWSPGVNRPLIFARYVAKSTRPSSSSHDPLLRKSLTRSLVSAAEAK